MSTFSYANVLALIKSMTGKMTLKNESLIPPLEAILQPFRILLDWSQHWFQPCWCDLTMTVQENEHIPAGLPRCQHLKSDQNIHSILASFTWGTAKLGAIYN